MLIHSILVAKLSCCGIEDSEKEWFTDKLFNRAQSVQYNNVQSEEKHVTSCVHQVSILGPALFMFFDDLFSVLRHSEAVMYADDTAMYVAGKDTFIIKFLLSADIKAIYEYFVLEMYAETSKITLSV